MKTSIQYIFSAAVTAIACTSFALAQSSYKDSASKLNPNFFSQGAGDSLPVKYVPGNASMPKGQMSLRNDFPYEQAPYQQSDALPYPEIRRENITFNVRLWKDIDTRQPGNRAMMYAFNDFGAQPLIALMLKAIKENKITAFSAINDRFTTPLTPAQVTEAMGNGLDTSATYDLDGNIAGYQVRPKAIDLDSIYTYCIKEDWFYDKNYGKMMVRIIGIAPVVSYTLSTGQVLPNSEHPIFWLYFPDFRSILTQYKAYNTSVTGTKIPFNELFDLRQFKGQIVKSDYQNPGEIAWNILMPNLEDQAREAKKIRQLIKNYGQNKYDMISENAPQKTRRHK